MSVNTISDLVTTILVMKPKPSPVPLIRIGGENDGAYLIPDDLNNIKACFSPGVNNRKTFEDELTDRYGIECHMCDKSSDIDKFITPLKEGMQTFKKKWLDVNGEPDTISLDNWVKELAPDEKDDLILQMDIEGAEYRNILQTSDKVLQRFRIIILEIHGLGVARNPQEFEINLGPFLRKLDEHFICVHAHPNNCCGDFTIVTPATHIHLPNVYELTFLRRDRFNEENISSYHEPMMPHPLDIKRNVNIKPPIFFSEESITQVPRIPASTIKLLEDKLDYYMSTIPKEESKKQDCMFKVYRLAQSIANNCLLEDNLKLEDKDISEIAEGKHYYLSSSYGNYPKEGLVETKQPFFFHTGTGLDQYITIDLEKGYILTSLLIVNRVDGCRERSRCLFYILHNTLKPNLSFGLPLNIDESFWQGDDLECRTALKKVKARYITIFSPENTALHFSSIRVFGVCNSDNTYSPINLALNKPTVQSSIFYSEYDPYGACNGKKTGKFGFHTNKERQPWWQIDLQAIYQLSEIKIYNRIDGYPQRSSTLNILLSLDALNWELYYSNDKENIFGGIDRNPLLVDMKDKIARFVKLQLREIEYFHLDEVEIYGLPLQKSDRLKLDYNQDEEMLSANFYGLNISYLHPVNLERVIARRGDGLGTRLIVILAARYIAEYFACNIYVFWPALVDKNGYNRPNILNSNSLEEVFENGKIFKDIDVFVINQQDFDNLKLESLLELNNKNNVKKNQGFSIFDKQQTEIIAQCKYLLCDDGPIVPYETSMTSVSLKLKDYWQKINWHHSIINCIENFKNQLDSKPYLTVHIRRGDIIQRLLYENDIESLYKFLPALLMRFLPIKTAVQFILNSNFKDVVVCSECDQCTQIIIDQVRQNNPKINFYVTSEFVKSLSETQVAAYDLIVMSSSTSVLTARGSSFSTCSELAGGTNRAKILIDWEDIANELITYLNNNNDVKMRNERKSLIYLHISKYVQDKNLAESYRNLAKRSSNRIFNKFINKKS